MKKFLKNPIREFFLLLASILLMSVPLSSCIYIFYTDSILWRFHACLVVLTIGGFVTLMINRTIPDQELDIAFKKILTVVVAFNFLIFLSANAIITFPIIAILVRFNRTRRIGFSILKFISLTTCFILGVRIIEEGDKPTEPCIFAPNHRGSLDYVLANLLVKKTLWQVVAGDNLIKFFPFSLFARISCIFIDREKELKNQSLQKLYAFYKSFFGTKPLNKVITEAGKFIKKGYSIVVYFEGTRKRPWVDSILVPEEETPQGTFLMAIRNRTDVVPVAIYGSDIYKEPIKGNPEQKKWYESRWWITPTTVNIYYCSKVTIINEEGKLKDPDEIMKEVRFSITERLTHFKKTAS